MNILSEFDMGSTIVPLSEEMQENSTDQIKRMYQSKKYQEYDFYKNTYIGRVPLIKKEKYIADNLCAWSYHKTAQIPSDKIDSYISEYEEQEGLSLAPEQKSGVHVLLSENLAILTGGPGTGKTSVLKCILYCILRHYDKFDVPYGKPDFPFALTAPTGKAARRMSEATGYPAKTLLSQLEYSPYNDAIRPLTMKYLFIDEASMLDIDTMYHLMRAVQTNADIHLYFIGDTQQLPSVGPGSVLRDMIGSQMIATNELVKTFRQKEGSTLLENIDIIKKGCNCAFVEGDDFEVHEDIKEFLPLYYRTIAEVGYTNAVVLTPNRKVGANCSNNLNRIIQAKINQRSGFDAIIKRDGADLKISFRYGDPVIQLVNREVVNGEVGVVVFADSKKVVVEFSEGKKITYTSKTINQLDLAYAISIHKSQGSEYPIAFVLCDKSRILDRNMIYTAVTRAKKKCFIFGNSDFISAACKKQSTWARRTTLMYALEEEHIHRALLYGKWL